MRKLLIAFPASVLLLLSLSLWGCGSDDEGPVAIGPGACSMELTELLTAQRFLPGAPDSQTVILRWDKEGDDYMMNLDLYKGGNKVTRVVSGGENSGYYSWRADNNGAEDGPDFSLRLSAFSDSTCYSDTDEFVLLNTIGSEIGFTNDFPDSMHVDDVLTFTWENTEIPGLVEILLDIRDQPSHVIATDLPHNGSFEWTVSTFGVGTFDQFTFRIVDTTIPVYCLDNSRYMKIEDPE